MGGGGHITLIHKNSFCSFENNFFWLIQLIYLIFWKLWLDALKWKVFKIWKYARHLIGFIDQRNLLSEGNGMVPQAHLSTNCKHGCLFIKKSIPHCTNNPFYFWLATAVTIRLYRHFPGLRLNFSIRCTLKNHDKGPGENVFNQRS